MRILFVTDTYYPDSSATTTLGRRTAEALAAAGYSVDVYPAEICGNHFSYPEEYNGVRIIHKESSAPLYYVPVKAFEDHEFDDTKVHDMVKILEAGNYDAVFSVALAFEIHFLTHEAIRQILPHPLPLNSQPLKWFPMSYDPYAFDPHISEEQRQERKDREVAALQVATKVFFLTEFKDDYIGSPIENKIEWFMLPCIRPINPDRSRRVIQFDSSYINCVFLGDFYYGVENTDFIFRLFEHIDKRIRLYTIGNVCDYQDTVNLWKETLGGRYICHERISQEEAENVMLDCDVLVSMGHDSANMCPSKVIDFVSSGKPILHIEKIPNCCAAKYLERYPNKYCIYQGDLLTNDKIREVEDFIVSSDTKPILPFDTVETLYQDFTMESLIEKIIKFL